MGQPIVFIFKLRVREGRVDDLKRYLREINDFVEANEPRISMYRQFIDEAGSEMTDVQIHPDSESMEFHMQVAGAKIGEAFEYVETKSVEVCGTLSDALLHHMRQVAGSGVPVSIKSSLGGFDRLRAG
jgi:hypothetical protein